MKKRNLFTRPKKRSLSFSKKRNLDIKPKRRKLGKVKDSYYINKIIKSLSTPLNEGGGVLFEKGLFEYYKLSHTYIPHKIYNLMLTKDLIERKHCFGCGKRGYHIYTLVLPKKKRRKL